VQRNAVEDFITQKNFQNICLKKNDALYTTATAATKKKMSQQNAVHDKQSVSR